MVLLHEFVIGLLPQHFQSLQLSADITTRTTYNNALFNNALLTVSKVKNISYTLLKRQFNSRHRVIDVIAQTTAGKFHHFYDGSATYFVQSASDN